MEEIISMVQKRKVGALYFWGFPQIDEEAERSAKIPDFELWLVDLKKGNCDHRVWLLTEKTVKKVQTAYYAVRNGKSPKRIRIHKENWNLADIYKFHPRGKEEALWGEI